MISKYCQREEHFNYKQFHLFFPPSMKFNKIKFNTSVLQGKSASDGNFIRFVYKTVETQVRTQQRKS